ASPASRAEDAERRSVSSKTSFGGQQSEVVQAVLAMAAAAPQTALRGAARGGDAVGLDGPVPMQGQGSVAQLRVSLPKSTASVALKEAEDHVERKPPAKSAKAAAAIAKRNDAAAASTRVKQAALVRSEQWPKPTKRVASLRGGMQRSFTSPDYWRVSYWQPY
ncbi:MAG: hypothetical protein K2Y05_00600, partial [Hyphomicrobiaceae bacterium]|nr:hypothetical protein [Hyphomicrobiaceae bacterium]